MQDANTTFLTIITIMIFGATLDICVVLGNISRRLDRIADLLETTAIREN